MATPTVDDQDPKPPRRVPSGRGIDLAIAAGVLAISLISLFVAVSANRTQERMLAASTWPSLQFGTSNVSTDGVPQLTFDVLNRGVGPARLRWSEVSVDGKPVTTLRELLSTCCAIDAPDVGFSSGLHQRVLGANEWIHLVKIPREAVDDAQWATLDRTRHDVRFRSCYCSVLDDCWVLDSREEQARPVDVCPAAPARVWGS